MRGQAGFPEPPFSCYPSATERSLILLEAEDYMSSQFLYRLPVGADPVEGRRPDHHRVHLGIRGRQRGPAAALRQGQEAAVGRGGPARLVAGRRPEQPDGHVGPDHRDPRDRSLEQPRPTKDRVHIRRNLQAHSLSQFMHGEQGALIATAKIVQTVAHLRVQVLRGDPGDGRGAPRGSLSRLLHEEVQASRTRSPPRWPSCSRRRSPTGAGT